MAIACISCPSPNFDARPKDAPVDILLMHYTGMKTGAEALARLCSKKARVSAHYTVDEDGAIYSHVPEECRAWHAGVSYWAGATDINARSIGIEIVNPGHEFGYRAFPEAQIRAVIALAADIQMRREIPSERVLGHSDVAPARKNDPGELFPWKTLAENGIGLWPDIPPPLWPRIPAPLTPLRIERRFAAKDDAFAAGLRRFGYGFAPDAKATLEQAVIAFQRHFRRRKIDGVPDAECERILASLLVRLDGPL